MLAVAFVFGIAGTMQAAWSERTVYVKFFSQKDPAWANEDMVPNYKMQRWGCLVTCTAMALVYYYYPTDPGRLNDWLGSHSGYDDYANVTDWRKIKDYTGERIIASRFSGDANSCFNKAKNEILSGRPCAIKTSLYGGHWILVRGYEKGGRDRNGDGVGDGIFTVNDPV